MAMLLLKLEIVLEFHTLSGYVHVSPAYMPAVTKHVAIAIAILK